MQSPVLTHVPPMRSLVLFVASPVTSMHSPVLAMTLRACYAESGTDVDYAATRLRLPVKQGGLAVELQVRYLPTRFLRHIQYCRTEFLCHVQYCPARFLRHVQYCPRDVVLIEPVWDTGEWDIARDQVTCSAGAQVHW
eukprot:26045-Rhodomonas_salina.1